MGRRGGSPPLLALRVILHRHSSCAVTGTPAQRGLLQRSLLQRSLLQRSLLQRGLLQRGLLQRSLLQSGLLQRSLLQSGLLQRSLLQHSLLQHSLLQHSLLQHSLLQRRSSTASVLFIPGLVDFDHRSTLAEALENLAASRCYDFR